MSARVKKAKKPPRSIQYLLCADPRLQKISLRRISDRLKKPKQPLRPIRSKNSAGAKTSMRLPWATSSWAILFGVICIVAAAAVTAARQPSQPADVASVEAPPEAHAPLEEAGMAARLETKKTVVAKAPAMAATANIYTAAVSTGNTPAVESVKAPAVESAARADVQNVAPVTITGCLELDEQTLWLKDTSGMDAPKSRSWRMGFLKKRSASIAIVDAVNKVSLPNHIGQRVALTGTLVNREMRVSSLERVAASCDQ